MVASSKSLSSTISATTRRRSVPSGATEPAKFHSDSPAATTWVVGGGAGSSASAEVRRRKTAMTAPARTSILRTSKPMRSGGLWVIDPLLRHLGSRAHRDRSLPEGSQWPAESGEHVFECYRTCVRAVKSNICLKRFIPGARVGTSVRWTTDEAAEEETVTQLSERQQQVLDYVRTVVADRGYPPSVREIGEALGLSSPSTVHSHLSALVNAGVIRRDPSKPRAIEVLDTRTTPSRAHDENLREVPLVGRIAAGSPVLATEDIEDVYSLPTSLVGSGPVFMLRVKGDSMVDAGILDGDLVVVRRQPDAN